MSRTSDAQDKCYTETTSMLINTLTDSVWYNFVQIPENQSQLTGSKNSKNVEINIPSFPLNFSHKEILGTFTQNEFSWISPQFRQQSHTEIHLQMHEIPKASEHCCVCQSINNRNQCKCNWTFDICICVVDSPVLVYKCYIVTVTFFAPFIHEHSHLVKLNAVV